MRRMRRPFALALAAELAALTSALLLASPAHAEGDCPPGSVQKSSDGFAWCEPTVCTNDGQCTPNEVCRPIPLCMQVGTLGNDPTADGGQRLLVTQRCAPDKTCPQKQTCSDMSRCVTRAAAEKMGELEAASASPQAASGEPKKSACGCDLIGAGARGPGAPAALALAVSFVACRRRRRR